MDLLRSFLFVPADSAKKMAKARTVHPDAFIFDLEDAVAPERKAQARELLLAELDGLPLGGGAICVRINGFRSTWWQGDLTVAAHPKVSAIFVPKCEDPREIAAIDESMGALEEKAAIPRGRIRLHLIVETALGALRVRELAAASSRVSGLCFGGEDFAADMGISRTHAPDEFLVPKSEVAMAAHAFRLHAIAEVFTDIANTEGLIADTKHGIHLGFTSKVLIHPSQIDPVHEAFRPSEPEARWAREVVHAFRQAKAQGAAVAVVGGRMVDEPILLQAQRILRCAGAEALDR